MILEKKRSIRTPFFRQEKTLQGLPPKRPAPGRGESVRGWALGCALPVEGKSVRSGWGSWGWVLPGGGGGCSVGVPGLGLGSFPRWRGGWAVGGFPRDLPKESREESAPAAQPDAPGLPLTLTLNSAYNAEK